MTTPPEQSATTDPFQRLGLWTLILFTALASLCTISLFLPETQEWIWIGTVHSKSIELIEKELLAANIVNRGQGNLGLDCIEVRPPDVEQARKILIDIRRRHTEHQPVLWIQDIDPPWPEHLATFGGTGEKNPD